MKKISSETEGIPAHSRNASDQCNLDDRKGKAAPGLSQEKKICPSYQDRTYQKEHEPYVNQHLSPIQHR